ncbi:YopX family protein, partial [Streptococcus pneumoniae]
NDYITAYPDEIELMQSTGLKDKNGKEIFEGDIVRTTRFLGRADEIGGFYEYEKDYVGVVKVLEGSWVIDTGSVAVRLWSEIDESEVLGNIYENLEFLEVNE